MANEKSIFKKLICPHCKKWKADHTGKVSAVCCGKPMYISDKWHVRLTREGRTKIVAVSPRKQDAIDYLHAAKDAIRRGDLLPGEEETISWQDARAEFVKWFNTLAPKSAAFYDCNLRNLEKVDLGGTFFTKLDLQDIEPKHLAAYRDARLAQVSPKTVHSEMGTLLRMFTLILETRTVRKFPLLHAAHTDLKKVKAPEVNNEKTRYLTAEQAVTLLENIHAPHLKLIVIIGIKTALRKMNILSLRRSQIDLENRAITIPREQMKSKRKDQDHVVPIDEELATLLRDWMIKNRTFDYLFPADTDRGTKTKCPHLTNISTGVNAAFERTGINDGVTRRQDKITFNVATRHTGATLALEHSNDIFSVSKLLDHSNTIITERKYAKKVQRKVAAVVELVGSAVKLVK